MERGNSSSEEEEEEEKDRISNLPDCLIAHILSFLYTEEAVQTCVLARRWRFLWKSVSVLKFSDKFHLYESIIHEGKEITTNGFINFVDKVLSLRDNSDIHRFDLDLKCTSCDDTDVIGIMECYECIDRWIGTAVTHNVQGLRIAAEPEGNFEIPVCLCTCKSLENLVLDLTGEYFDCEIILPHTMSLPQLKSLSIRLCDISFIDEKLTNGFFSSFPSLESLVMHMGHFGFGNMNLLMSLPKLRNFRFRSWNWRNDTVVEMNAPSLLSFSFDGYLSTKFTLTNLSSLVTVDIKIRIPSYDEVPETFDICEEQKEFYGQRTMGLLRGIRNVKVLMLDESFLKAVGGSPVILEAQHLEFFNLQRLEIQTYLSRDCLQSIFYLLKISPKIESFSVQLCQRNYNKAPPYPFCNEVKINPENPGDYWEAELSLPCMIRHLKFVEVKGPLGCVNELKLLEILLKHAMVLEEVVLASYYSTKKDAQMEKRLTKFSEMLQTFPKASKSIILSCKF